MATAGVVRGAPDRRICIQLHARNRIVEVVLDRAGDDERREREGQHDPVLIHAVSYIEIQIADIDVAAVLRLDTFQGDVPGAASHTDIEVSIVVGLRMKPACTTGAVRQLHDKTDVGNWRARVILDLTAQMGRDGLDDEVHLQRLPCVQCNFGAGSDIASCGQTIRFWTYGPGSRNDTGGIIGVGRKGESIGSVKIALIVGLNLPPVTGLLAPSFTVP